MPVIDFHVEKKGLFVLENTDHPAISKLAEAFTQALSRYLRADLDRTFKSEILVPLRKALHDYEKIEKDLYHGHSDPGALLLLRLRSVSLLVEGFYWIGSYDEAANELQRYAAIEGLLSSAAEKSPEAILHELSRLPIMREAKALLHKLASEESPVEEGRQLAPAKRRIVLEVIRIGFNMAVVFHYNKHKYEHASNLLEICGKLARAISPDNSRPYGLLAQIDYFTACTWRQVNRLIDSDGKLREVLDHYLHRTNLKFDQFMLTKQDAQSWEDFSRSAGLSRYRTAITLVARSDLNRRRGNLNIALYQNLAVAQIILAETKDTINRAYARMLSAIISREIYSTERDHLDALEEITAAEKDFEEMGHHKYRLRSTFERAYTLFYLARFYMRTDEGKGATSKERIREAIEILEELQNGADTRWLAQYLTLEGRLLIVKGDLTGKNGAEAKIDRAISLLNSTHGHRTYLVEALIAKSRVLMEEYVHSTHKSHQTSLLNKAEELLLRAQRENLNNTDGLPENSQIEAIINYALARIKIRQGDRSAAEDRLRTGSKHLPVIESDGVRRLFEHAKREISEAMVTFRVVNGLDLDRNTQALRVFILKESIDQARIQGRKPWEIMNTSRTTFYNLLNHNGLKWKE